MSWLLNHPIGDRWHETVRHSAELYDKEALKASLTKDQLFSISAVLVRSNCGQYIKKGIDILEHLATAVDSKTTHKSYLIYLSIGYIRMRNYELAKTCLKQLKLIDPNSRQAFELEDCIHKHQNNCQTEVKLRFSAETEDKELEDLRQYMNSTEDY